MPSLTHSIEYLIKYWLATFGTFGCIFILITLLAPGVLISNNERSRSTKWLLLINEISSLTYIPTPCTEEVTYCQKGLVSERNLDGTYCLRQR
jgi:hypothetical protein